jgi:hypothetical protein
MGARVMITGGLGYLDQRILFYINHYDTRQTQIDQSTSQLQTNLWAAVRGPAIEQPTPVAALVVSGMNDVINSQGSRKRHSGIGFQALCGC